MQHVIHAASAAVPCVSHAKAVAALAEGLSDPVLGPISIGEVQLCPQHSGTITEDLVRRLMAAHPATRFRLHASVRVANAGRHRIVDAGNAFQDDAHVREMARLSDIMDAPAYSIHAGSVDDATLPEAFDNVRRIADIFGRKVGIEGLYPLYSGRPKWLLATWSDHAEMLRSGIDYALDVSHLNIVARRERRQETALLDELISSPQCMEVHLSSNDGRADSHRPLEAASRPWWMPHLERINPGATVFYEGVLKMPNRKG